MPKVRMIHWFSVAGHWLTVHAREDETAKQALAREYLDGSGRALTNLCVTKPDCMTPGEWERAIARHAELKESFTPINPIVSRTT